MKYARNCAELLGAQNLDNLLNSSARFELRKIAYEK